MLGRFGVCCWALVSVLRAPVAACSLAALAALFALLGLLLLGLSPLVFFRCFGLREMLFAAALPGQRGRFSGRASPKRSVKKDLKDTASTRAKRSQL